MAKGNDPMVIRPKEIGYPPHQDGKQVKLAGPVTAPLVKVQGEPTPRKAS